MRVLILILVGLCFAQCNTEKSSDCIQTTGTIISDTTIVPPFERILVRPNVSLQVQKGTEYQVTITTGQNLRADVKASVLGDRLILENTNNCNLLRDYEQTTILVTTPTLAEIRNASQFTIRSAGVLEFPSLQLISEDFVEFSEITSGNFELTVSLDELVVVSNNLSSFKIRGSTNLLEVFFASGIGRFDGPELIANDVNVFHRGANAIVVNPIQSLKGSLRSTGDLIAKNRPPIVEIQTFYKGKLRFE